MPLPENYWPTGYQKKYICVACKAQHFYLPSKGCVVCSFLRFRVVNRSVTKKNEDNAVPRVNGR